MILQIGHDYFDIPDEHDYFDTQIGSDGKHPRMVVKVTPGLAVMGNILDKK
jgi:hypothetical protein